ncbi:hypothetical protein ACP70R_043472 [Stipagrostis hirtigluma subsp. patula]
MTLKSNRCSEENYREPLLCRKKEFKSAVIRIVDSSLNSSSLPANSISVPASEDGCYLNKRRKMDEEYNSLLTNGNMRESTRRSFTPSGNNSSLSRNGDGKSHMVSSSVEVSKSAANTVEYSRDYQEHAEASVGSFLRNSARSHSDVNDGQSSSISSVEPYINRSIEDTLKCSSPDVNAAKPVTELSARDLCISILKRDIFPTKEAELRRTSTTIASDDNESSPLFECAKCGSMEDPSNMLICDRCEGAFHLSCCHPRIKKIPEEEWYCQVCARKKPRRQHEKLKSPNDGLPKGIQRPRRGLGAIRDMFVDSEPYETEVRIGRDFQADVPEWSGPVSSNEDQFGEPSELDPSKTTMLGRLQGFKDKKTSIGNWIQCREVLDTGVVCGKWRRAPLFVVQSSNWDCSCSVIWDPIHADCAVPQELETDEVLKQLKYINKLKNRLGDSSQKH